MVSHDGQLYEKDLGPGSDAIARAMTRFDPDASWKKVAVPGGCRARERPRTARSEDARVVERERANGEARAAYQQEGRTDMCRCLTLCLLVLLPLFGGAHAPIRRSAAVLERRTIDGAHPRVELVAGSR
jgi:hypothetical protein